MSLYILVGIYFFSSDSAAKLAQYFETIITPLLLKKIDSASVN